VNPGRGAVALTLLLGACGTAPTPDPTTCDLANARVGEVVCTELLTETGQWDALAADAAPVDQGDALKYLVPAAADAPLPAMFVNSQRYALHYDFLREVFPDTYGALAWDSYVAMVIDPERRVYWGGDVADYHEAGGARRYGFIVWDDPADIATVPTYDEVLYVWRELQARFGLGELMFVPASNNQRAAVASWPADAPFAVRGDDSVTYEAYHTAVGYGTVRFQPLAELAGDAAAGEFGYQDLLVLDEAPMDMDRVVSGVVTGTRQASLSHLNVRMSARDTPNCYTAEPWTKLAAWEGRLVRLECGDEALHVEAATAAEAEAFWAAMRPDPVEISPPDTSWQAWVPLVEVATDDAAGRRESFLRFGAKGTNLATLYQRIEPGAQFDGFVVPFAWYQRFLDTHTWDAPGVGVATFGETLAAWHTDETFLANAAVRAERLAALRAAMTEAEVDPADVATLADAVRATFGGSDVMVRLRSSSNAEDGVEFSGAGLYESVSACVADDDDADDDGPSRCDDGKDDEKPLADALRAVWASLWSAGAWEERAWYGMDQGAVAMAVLVNDQAEDEQANLVAFTGNPTAEDPRWLVEAQVGDLDVVAAEPGVTPERTLLTVEGGEVVQVERVDRSSEVDEDDEVLSDARLGEVGALLWEIDAVMPFDGVAPTGTLMWDTEQKVLEDGRLVVKQVRPFVR